jgi:hypothetical protein
MRRLADIEPGRETAPDACGILRGVASDDEVRLEEIRRLFAQVGYVMLGPINPGRDAETKARVGWVAPYGRATLVAGVAAAGHGWTPREAAEDAWAQFEAEFGSPPGTAE